MALRSNELMIGDWVNPLNEAIQGPCRVLNLGDDVALIGNSSKEWIATTAELEGIPLTAEILEKNGFDVSDPEVAQYHFNEDGQRMHFSLRRMYDSKTGKPDGYSFFAFNVLSLIVYVHELQHALRLCGIEKEIVL